MRPLNNHALSHRLPGRLPPPCKRRLRGIILTLGLWPLLLPACAPSSPQEPIYTAVAGTQAALAATQTEIAPVKRPQDSQTGPALLAASPLPSPAPSLIPSSSIPATQATGTAAPTPTARVGVLASCGEILTVRVSAAPELQAALFEHHPRGVFLVIALELTNRTGDPIQVWDGDYFLVEEADGEQALLSPHKDATGYLYNEKGLDWYQAHLQPDEPLQTMLVFDVHPQGSGRFLILKPGSEAGEERCEVRVALEE